MAIIRDILPGLAGAEERYVVEPDRRAAIALAMDLAAPGDVVILCGKGHETYQEIKGVKYDMDDRVLIREVLEEQK